MADARLYDDVVMEHIKNARNYRVLDDADRKATGTNPLCGDDLVVYLKLAGERIADVSFQCTCCGISMASASIMTEMVKGRRADEAKAVLRGVLEMLSSGGGSVSDGMSAGPVAMLETVRKFPAQLTGDGLAGGTLFAHLAWRLLRSYRQSCSTMFSALRMRSRVAANRMPAIDTSHQPRFDAVALRFFAPARPSHISAPVMAIAATLRKNV